MCRSPAHQPGISGKGVPTPCIALPISGRRESMFMSEKVKVPGGAGATERPGLPGRPPRPAPATTAQASTLSPASDGGCPSRAHLAPSLWLRGTPGHRAAEKTEPDGTCARHHARSGGGRRRLGDQSDGGGTAAPRGPREGLASMRSRSVKRHSELVGRWAEDRAGRARPYGSVPVRKHGAVCPRVSTPGNSGTCPRRTGSVSRV